MSRRYPPSILPCARYAPTLTCIDATQDQHVLEEARRELAETIYRAIGSIAFAAAARSVLVVARDQSDESRRLILPAKNNLGPDTGGLAYTITTTSEGVPHLVWDAEPVTMTADDALSPAPADDERTERDAAAEWLREVLADGPMPARDVRRQADEAGHN